MVKFLMLIVRIVCRQSSTREVLKMELIRRVGDGTTYEIWHVFIRSGQVVVHRMNWPVQTTC
jgi:hypothetical protein